MYRCWLAFTARTPDTLRRDDLADRLLLLPVSRIGDKERLRETDVYRKVAAQNGITLEDRTTMKLASVHTIHEAVEVTGTGYIFHC